MKHLGLHVYLKLMREYVADLKVLFVRGLEKIVLLIEEKNRRLVLLALLRLQRSVRDAHAAVLMDGFYMPFIHFNMTLREKMKEDRSCDPLAECEERGTSTQRSEEHGSAAIIATVH